MGAHAFTAEPEHCDAYRRAGFPDLPRTYGLAERWNMPFARHRRTLRGVATFPGVAHYVLTFQRAGAETRRVDGTRPWPAAGPGAASLQAPGNAATIEASGALDYVHLYFRESLLDEVAAEAAVPDRPAAQDFFAVRDAALARDIAAYVARAADDEQPADSIEMDGRAYLVALGVLRLARRDALGPLALRPVDGRADLRPAIELIEARLGERLRLSELAGAVRMSPFHFSRMFRAATGETPSAYLARRRVEAAVAAIRGSDAPLAAIALDAGFSSQSHMNRRVKAATGLTPGAVRAGR